MTESGPLGPESAPATEGVLTAEDSALRARRDRIAAKSGGSLRVHAARGVMINAAFSIVLQGLSVFRGFVAASFIAPADYAVWSIIVIGFTAIGQLKQVGIVDKYIQQDDPDEEVAFQKAFTLEAILTGGMGLVLAAATPLLALAYRAPEIIAPALVGLLALPANILQTPIWAYQREMEFTRTRMLAAVDPVVGAIATIAGAIAGAGYWSFVLGVVLGSWAGALVVVTRSPYRLRFRYERGTTRQYVRFSVPILFAKLSNSFLLTGVL